MQKNGSTEPGSPSQTAEEKAESIRETVKGYVDQGAQRVDKIKNRVVEAKEQALSRGNDVLDRVSDVIKAHPLTSVGIAFGVGYLGMRVFRR